MFLCCWEFSIYTGCGIFTHSPRYNSTSLLSLLANQGEHNICKIIIIVNQRARHCELFYGGRRPLKRHHTLMLLSALTGAGAHADGDEHGAIAMVDEEVQSRLA